MREPYSLHKRLSKKGRPVYYVQFRDAQGNRLSALSTHCTSKGAADRWARVYQEQHGNFASKTFS